MSHFDILSLLDKHTSVLKIPFLSGTSWDEHKAVEIARFALHCETRGSRAIQFAQIYNSFRGV